MTDVSITDPVLDVLVQDERFDEPGLEAFLADARKLADEWSASEE